MMVYASPVDKATGIIADFGMTLYLGNDSALSNHLKVSFEVVKKIFGEIKEGMRLSDIASLGRGLMQERGFFSELSSPSDPTGTNIGHTIPGSYEEWSSEEKKTFSEADKKWTTVCNLIRQKRRFINSVDDFRIRKGMALTLEPRPEVANNPHIPTAFFHTIILIHENGSKELLTDFDELFRITRMDYLLST